jgi:hypothetical protein
MSGFGGKRVCIRLGCALTRDLGYLPNKLLLLRAPSDYEGWKPSWWPFSWLRSKRNPKKYSVLRDSSMLNITMGIETAEAVKESLVVLTARRVHCEWRPGSCRTIVHQWRSLGCHTGHALMGNWRVDDSWTNLGLEGLLQYVDAQGRIEKTSQHQIMHSSRDRTPFTTPLLHVAASEKDVQNEFGWPSLINSSTSGESEVHSINDRYLEHQNRNFGSSK